MRALRSSNGSCILLAAVLALACGAASAREHHRVPEYLRDVHRIVTLGDSITEQGGRPGGYVWQIGEYLHALYPRHPFEVVNAGISGHKSSDMLARFQRDVLDRHPDLVTISVGINDVWHGFFDNHPLGYGPRRVPLPEFRKNVAEMLERARRAHVKVVLFTTTIFEDDPHSIRNSRVAFYNDALRQLAEAYGARLADQNAAFTEAWERNRASGAKLTVDQVHMAPSGDALMARTAILAFGIPPRDLDDVKAEVMRKATGR